MNHIKPGVVGGYNKYRYDKEKKDASSDGKGLLVEILKNKPVADEGVAKVVENGLLPSSATESGCQI